MMLGIALRSLGSRRLLLRNEGVDCGNKREGMMESSGWEVFFFGSSSQVVNDKHKIYENIIIQCLTFL